MPRHDDDHHPELYEDGDYETTGVAAVDYTDWRYDPNDEPNPNGAALGLTC